MNKNVITIDINASVGEAAKKLAQHEIGSLIITEGKKNIGIVTERDITYRYVAKKPKADKNDVKVKEIMSRPLITLSLDKNPNTMDAVVIMSKYKIKRVCITKKGKLVGILAELDLFKELAESYISMLKNMVSRL